MHSNCGAWGLAADPVRYLIQYPGDFIPLVRHQLTPQRLFKACLTIGLLLVSDNVIRPLVRRYLNDTDHFSRICLAGLFLGNESNFRACNKPVR